MANTTTSGAPETPQKITADDLRSKLQAFQGDVQGKVEARKNNIIAIVGGGALVLMLLFFFLGKRAGKKKSAVIEIRRV